MSVGRVSDNFEYDKEYFNSSVNNQDDVVVFGDSQINENYSELSPIDNSVSSQQVNLSNAAGGGNTTASQQEQLTQALTDYLENMVLAYEEQFQAVKDNNGWIAKGWDWFKNTTGIGAGSDKVQKEIDKLKKKIEKLKKDPSKLNDVYKSVTGNELNDEELNNLINGQVDLSHSKVVESVSKYTQGQKMCTNIISGIASSLAVVGLVAGGIVAAPFTGGMSLGASAAAIGTLTAAGTAAYMIPQAVDGFSEKDGYSFKEVMQDVSNGVVNSAFTAVGMGAGKAVGSALGKTAINKTVAGLAASETTSLIIGDGIGIGNYLTEAAFNDDVDFSWADLGKTAAVSTASSAVAGATAFGVSSVIRPALTSGTTASSQIIGRFISAGITGGSAGMSAAAVGGSTNYLLTCAIDGKEVSFDEWLNASTENLGTAALSGFIGGMAFEAVHLAAGTPKPEGTVKTVKGVNEDGLKYTSYLDKNGNVLATDISNSDIAKIYGSNNEQGLTQYDGSAPSEGKIYDTTRTIRISYTNIPDVQSFGSQDGVEVFTQTPSDNYRADITLHDWADNSFYLGSGIVNGDNIPNPNANNNVVYNSDYEVIYDDPISSDISANAVNTPQLSQGTQSTQENGLVPAQNDTGVQLTNPNSQNIDLVVDTTLAQLAAQQTQMANVQAQAQDAIISANAATAGLTSTQTAYAQNVTLQNNSAQISSSIMTTEELESAVLKILEKNKNFEWLSQNRDINKLCTEFAKIIKYSCDKLQNEHNINLSEQAMLDIIEAGEYTDDSFYVYLTESDKCAGRAYVLAQLKNCGAVNSENICKNTEWFGSTAFTRAYNPKFKDCYEDILKDAGYNEQEIKFLEDIAEKISFNSLSTDNFNDFNWTDIRSNFDESALKLIDAGTNMLDVKLYQDKLDYNGFLTSIGDITGYTFEFKKLQNGAGVQLVAKKEITSIDNPQMGNDITVIKTVTMNADGTIIKSTTEKQGDKSQNWYYGKDRIVILNKINNGYDIASQIEIVNNENGEPSYIIYTKASNTLEGAYETVRYDLSDYPEDMDVIEAIENGTIQGGKVLSSVSTENAVTQYQENYEYENSNISRNYTQKVDETGKVESYEYKYDITDTEGKPLLSMERSWGINSDGTTTTIVNGRIFTASFDEDNMIVSVTQDDGSSITIDFQSKLSPYDPNDSFQRTTFGDEKTMKKAFFEFIKTLPADQLVILSNCSEITLVENLDSRISNDQLKTGLNIGTLSHEMGHGIDFKFKEVDVSGTLSGNQELIDIYNEEMDSFKLKYPELAQELIKYFSQTGGGVNSGLSELLAETNMLMTTYGDNTSEVETRSEYLVRYFPKTVAKIAELLGYNTQNPNLIAKSFTQDNAVQNQHDGVQSQTAAYAAEITQNQDLYTQSLTQETTKPQFPTPKEIEQRTAFLKENYPNMDDSNISMLAESNNTLYQNAVELINMAKNAGIKDVERYLAYFTSSEEKIYFLKECMNKGVIKYSSDFRILASSLSEEQIPRAIRFVNAGIVNIPVIKQLSSLADEEQVTRVFELQELCQNAGISDIDYYLADWASSETSTELVKTCINAGMSIYDIRVLCRLPKEQHTTAIKCINAGMSTYDIKFVCTLPEEQHSTAIELIKAGGIISYDDIKEICSLPKDVQTRTIELKKLCQNVGINIREKELADFASSQEKADFIKECINRGIIKDFWDMEKFYSLSEEQIPSAIKFIQAGYTNCYDISKLAALPDNQIENALKIIQAIGENLPCHILEKLSQEKYSSKTIDMINKGVNIEDIDLYCDILEDAHNNYDVTRYNNIIDIKAQFENLGTMEQEIAELNLILDYLYKTGSAEYKRYIDIIGNDVNISLTTVGEVVDIASDDIKYKQIMSLKNKGFSVTSAVNYNYIFNSGLNLNDLTLSEKISIFSNLAEIKSEIETKTGVEGELAKINPLFSDLNKELNQIIMPTDVTAEAQTAMFQGFFANNNSQLENTLATTDFSQFGKEGIPLEYSRTEFLSDLSKTLEGLSETEQADILKKLGITPAEGGLANGYDGIINVNTENLELDLKNPVEAKVYELANKFIRENSVHTGDEALDEALNSLIKGMPEFINVIGKQQHATQELSVDAHILKVLQEAMSNEQYQNLSSLDKTILKISVVLHDIAKSEGVVDKEHPAVSALYARNILEKYSLPINVRDRIFELIKNHHWLEQYNTDEINADYTATMFRHKDDFTIAQIMAEADLKGVSESFYNFHKDALDKVDIIGDSQDKINQTGQIVFTSKIVTPGLIPTQEYNGQTYKVINFSQLPSDFDLSQYGFAPETTPDSLRLFVHMSELKTNLEKVFTLSDVAKGGFLCASYISLADKSTYYEQTIGVSLEVENVNIANAGNENQGSGGQKDFASFSEIITGDTKNSGPYNMSKYRNIIPNTIKQELNLTDDEYKLFYEQFSSLKYETQIRDDKEYTIGSKTFKGADIKAAIKNANNNLFNKFNRHNESNLYNPKINAVVAKYNSLEELAAEYPDILEFAQEHNLPIYLLGK